MGSRKHRVVGRGTMKLHLISILALWSCAEWGRVDAQNRPTMPNFPDFDPRGAQHSQPQHDAMEISESDEECCPCNQREHGYGGGYGHKSHFGGGYGYKSHSGYGHRFGGYGYVGPHSNTAEVTETIILVADTEITDIALITVEGMDPKVTVHLHTEATEHLTEVITPQVMEDTTRIARDTEVPL